MAEGGDISFENPAYDPYDDPYDDDRFDETTPFIQQTSTPYSGGENIEMQTMQHEASGLPEKSYAVTSFGGRPSSDEAAWLVTKDLFPNMSSTGVEVFYDTKGKLQVKMFGAGKKNVPPFYNRQEYWQRDYQQESYERNKDGSWPVQI